MDVIKAISACLGGMPDPGPSATAYRALSAAEASALSETKFAWAVSEEPSAPTPEPCCATNICKESCLLKPPKPCSTCLRLEGPCYYQDFLSDNYPDVTAAHDANNYSAWSKLVIPIECSRVVGHIVYSQIDWVLESSAALARKRYPAFHSALKTLRHALVMRARELVDELLTHHNQLAYLRHNLHLAYQWVDAAPARIKSLNEQIDVAVRAALDGADPSSPAYSTLKKNVFQSNTLPNTLLVHVTYYISNQYWVTTSNGSKYRPIGGLYLLPVNDSIPTLLGNLQYAESSILSAEYAAASIESKIVAFDAAFGEF